jgi:hypothetical protein
LPPPAHRIIRLVGNEKLELAELLPLWSRHLLAGCDEAFVNMDWTDFDDDGQAMLVLSLQTHHGRAMPLMWRTVLKACQTTSETDPLATSRIDPPPGVHSAAFVAFISPERRFSLSR